MPDFFYLSKKLIMKSLLNIALFLLLLVGLNSCQVCTTCTARDKVTGEVDMVSVEFCGSKQEVEDFKLAHYIAWGAADDVTCE
ncbi:MAG: hypothetical protein A2W91_09075 [Bacteroidetes bacterium GWF2_38_335]|nr:MAG: hypothetical protein A2W91_09075 [Bacteroidetes bacterium GWF2_38_335]OFY80523.1 MAG: hypothetical protein A2281_08800 [Bacteroidetes bacterium RIFOXYA12_FULL_38_20]HBS85866.1 hypothetical protein [Bacteroidales bacterium]